MEYHAWRSVTHLLGRGPLEVVDGAVEADIVGDLWACNLPGVAIAEPDVWQLLLVSLGIDGLLHSPTFQEKGLVHNMMHAACPLNEKD